MKKNKLFFTTVRLATDGMLIALYLVLSIYCSFNAGVLRFTTDGFPIIICGFIFGPIDGLIVGSLGAFLSQMIMYGFSATTLLWILPAAARGLIIGLVAKACRYNPKFPIVIISIIFSSLIVTVLNTVAIFVDAKVYGYPAAVLGISLVYRISAGVLSAVVYAAVTYPLLTSLKKSGISERLRGKFSEVGHSENFEKYKIKSGG